MCCMGLALQMSDVGQMGHRWLGDGQVGAKPLSLPTLMMNENDPSKQESFHLQAISIYRRHGNVIPS